MTKTTARVLLATQVVLSLSPLTAHAAVDWSKVLHQLVARNVNYNPRKIEQSFYYSPAGAAALGQIKQQGPVNLNVGPAAKLDTPATRLQSVFGDDVVSTFKSSNFAYLKTAGLNASPTRPWKSSMFEAPIFKSLATSRTMVIIVPGLGSDHLPLVPFTEAIQKYRKSRTGHSNKFGIMVAQITAPNNSSTKGSYQLAAYLKDQTPLFDECDETKPSAVNCLNKRQIIFIAADQAVNQVLEMLANKSNAQITNRTRAVISLNGLTGGVSFNAQQAARGANSLAHGLALSGEFLGSMIGRAGSGELRKILQGSLQSHIKDAITNSGVTAALPEEFQDVTELGNLAAPALEVLGKDANIGIFQMATSSRVQAILNSSILSPETGLPQDAYQSYANTVVDTAKTYSTVLTGVRNALADLEPTHRAARTQQLLASIQRTGGPLVGKPIAIFTVGSVAPQSDYRITPELRWDGQQLKALSLGAGKGGQGGFSWDDLLWYVASQPGYYQNALYNGFTSYPSTLLDQPANSAIKVVDLGFFRTTHWGLTVGGVLSPHHPFPRSELFAALLETVDLYEKASK